MALDESLSDRNARYYKSIVLRIREPRVIVTVQLICQKSKSAVRGILAPSTVGLHCELPADWWTLL